MNKCEDTIFCALSLSTAIEYIKYLIVLLRVLKYRNKSKRVCMGSSFCHALLRYQMGTQIRIPFDSYWDGIMMIALKCLFILYDVLCNYCIKGFVMVLVTLAFNRIRANASYTIHTII